MEYILPDYLVAPSIQGRNGLLQCSIANMLRGFLAERQLVFQMPEGGGNVGLAPAAQHSLRVQTWIWLHSSMQGRVY